MMEGAIWSSDWRESLSWVRKCTTEETIGNSQTREKIWLCIVESEHQCWINSKYLLPAQLFTVSEKRRCGKRPHTWGVTAYRALLYVSAPFDTIIPLLSVFNVIFWKFGSCTVVLVSTTAKLSTSRPYGFMKQSHIPCYTKWLNAVADFPSEL